jgi:hypothetical protein
MDPGKTWKEADSIDDRWNETDLGPFLASVLRTPAGVYPKGLSIHLDKGSAAVGYNLQNGSLQVAWSGDFLSFSDRRYGITSAPSIAGTVLFQCSTPAWGKAPVRYLGTYQHGTRVVLSYQVADATILESPTAQQTDDGTVISRTLQVGPHKTPLHWRLLDKVSKLSSSDGLLIATQGGIQIPLSISGAGMSSAAMADAIEVELPASSSQQVVKVSYYPGSSGDKLAGLRAATPAAEDLALLTKPGPALWPQEIATSSQLGTEEGPFQVDTIGVPFENPFGALMFLAGHDFFSDGTLAACTMHGDVWLVTGLDDKLDNVRWRRFATGLHQSMGLRIIKDRLYVLGKDQITILHDRDGNGEADYYENFNSAGQTSIGGHDFAACLETDPDGNFYYIRAHEGVVRVSADGTSSRSIATGFRNPVGLGVGPNGVITATPQEGTWTPASCIIEIQEGGYYGFGGPQKTEARPLGYDPPLCWMPRLQDNSSGGQIWVTSDKWGPLKGQMLHLSYGQCALLVVMREVIDERSQGGTFKLPYLFKSGVMRGRFSPTDGQLYLTGLRGWQTLAADDGCLERLRYTGQESNIPQQLNVTPTGVRIRFTDRLDKASASDPDNYAVDWWNYRYSKEYGSKDYKVSDSRQPGREEVYVEDVRLLPDGHTVELILEEIRPVMQMEISFAIKSATGQSIKNSIFNTIHKVPESNSRGR